MSGHTDRRKPTGEEMSTMQTTLPPRPDLEATPSRPDITTPMPLTTAPAKKKRTWLWITIGIVIALILGVTGTAMANLGDEDTTTTGPQSVQDIYDELQPGESAPVAETGIAAVDLNAVIEHTDNAIGLMDQAAAASLDLDVSGSAYYTLQAADEWYAISDLWEPVPEMADRTERIAVHYETAGNLMDDAVSAINSGDVTLATALIDEATREIQGATADIDEATRMAESYQ
jgi:hypothetical protein